MVGSQADGSRPMPCARAEAARPYSERERHAAAVMVGACNIPRGEKKENRARRLKAAGLRLHQLHMHTHDMNVSQSPLLRTLCVHPSSRQGKPTKHLATPTWNTGSPRRVIRSRRQYDYFLGQDRKSVQPSIAVAVSDIIIFEHPLMSEIGGIDSAL